MSIRDTDTSRYKFFGARVVLKYSINIHDDVFEDIKLGEFTITDAERTDKTKIKFTAYDDMRKLDKNLPAESLIGKPYDMLVLASQSTGYPLAFDEAYVTNNFINTQTNMYIDSTSGLKTWRDLVKTVCQLLGCFARDNRNGAMELVKYHTVSDTELTTSNFYTVTVADYTCTYVGLAVTSARGTYTSQLGSEVQGLVMKIPDAPAWDNGIDVTLQNQTDALFSVLQNIVYTPTTIDMPSDPAFDCGDRVTVVTDDGEEIETIITSYDWHFSKMTLTSKGVNPYVQGVSTSDIASTRLLGKDQQSSKFTYYTYVNGIVYEINTTFDQIVRLPFKANSDTTVTLWHEFKWLNTFAVDTQEITLKYYLDGDEFSYSPVQTYGENGYHTFGTQFWLQDLDTSRTHIWEVYAKTSSGTAFIDRGDLHVLLQGQNLESQDKFNGELIFEEAYSPFVLGEPLGDFIESVADHFVNRPVDATPADEWGAYTADDDPFLTFRLPVPSAFADTHGAYPIGQNIVGLTGTLGVVQEKEHNYIVTEGGDNIATEDDDTLIT